MTSTSAGPIENQESASALTTRDGSRVPWRTSIARAETSAVATSSGASEAGPTNSAGTKAS